MQADALEYCQKNVHESEKDREVCTAWTRLLQATRLVTKSTTQSVAKDWRARTMGLAGTFRARTQCSRLDICDRTHVSLGVFHGLTCFSVVWHVSLGSFTCA